MKESPVTVGHKSNEHVWQEIHSKMIPGIGEYVLQALFIQFSLRM